MEEVLRTALEPVLRDLARAGLEAPTFEDGDWIDDPERPSSMMWTTDGTGASVAVTRAASLVERVVEATDRVQEWVIESHLRRQARTNWPRCPHHPGNHPLQPVARGAQAVWACPGDGTMVAPIGSIE
jgi:hypothetical protein